MFKVLRHQRNANENDSEIITHIKKAKIKNPKDSTCWLGSGARGTHHSIDGGSANLYNHFENQFGVFSENCKQLYLNMQLYCFRVYTEMELYHIPQGHMTHYIHKSFTDNRQILETTQMVLT